MTGIVVDHPSGRIESLLRRARRGDHDAFAGLVREHEAMVYSIALHALRRADAADELAQDVFLKLYRNLGQIESADHLRFWLRRVSTNGCIDALRRRREELPVEEQLRAGEPSESDILLHARLRTLVAALPEQQRMAIILRYQEEMQPSEISEVLDLPLNTVKSHIRRAIARLRTALDERAIGREPAREVRL